MSPSPVTIEPLDRPPDLEVMVPGSKSHTNRALICAALAQGSTELRGALFADDTVAMMDSLSTLGIVVETRPDEAGVRVEGCGGQVPPGPVTLDVAQSGTTGRFLACLAALGPGPYVIDGDDQLRDRPFGHLVDALRQLGVTVDQDRLPLTIGYPAPGPGGLDRAGSLGAGTVAVPGSVSSQFLSGLLMVAPYAHPGPQGQREVVIEVAGELVSVPYVELTLATMATFGAKVDRDRNRFTIHPEPYQGGTVDIEPDASAASYFLAAAAISGGRVRIPGLGRRSVQGDVAFVDVLAAMGATVAQGDDWIEVTGGAPLRGVEVDMADISDVAPTLAVVATFASTPTTVRGIGFIRRKETDRLAAVVTELKRLGIEATENDDGFTIAPGTPKPGTVETYRDHRMAMSFALLGLVHPGITIADPDCVAKTFPRYFSVLDELRRP